MKKIVVRFKLADESKTQLPTMVIKQLGMDRSPVRAFEVEDNVDEDDFLKEVMKKMRKKFMSPMSLEIIRVERQ